MIILNTKIGKQLKTLRGQSKFSQEEVAKRAGLSRPHYTSIENGKHVAEDETLKKILIALNIPMSQAQDMVSQWRIEDALEKAADPSKVINSIVAGDNSIVITGGNNQISK